MRSSCDASEHQATLGEYRGLERVEGGVVGAGQAAELVVATLGQAPARVGACSDRLGLLREAAHRRQRGPRDGAAQHRGEDDPDDRDRDEDDEEVRKDLVDLVQRAGDLDRTAARERGGEDAQMVSGDRAIDDLRLTAAGGNRAVGGAHGQPRPGTADRPPARADQLHHARRSPEAGRLGARRGNPALRRRQRWRSPGRGRPGRARRGAAGRCGALPQGGIDLASQLRPDRDVGPDRGEDDRYRHRQRRGQRQPPGDAHAVSRST